MSKELAVRNSNTALVPMDELLFDIDSPEVEEGFVVNSLDKATWCAQRYIAAEKRISERKELADFYKNKIDIWLSESSKSDANTMSVMASLIEPYAREYVSGLKNRHSFKVLGASIGFRKHPDKLDISDEDSAVRFCEEHYPDIIQSKKTISKTLAKAYLKDGSRIPGLELSVGNEELVIHQEV